MIMLATNYIIFKVNKGEIYFIYLLKIYFIFYLILISFFLCSWHLSGKHHSLTMFLGPAAGVRGFETNSLWSLKVWGVWKLRQNRRKRKFLAAFSCLIRCHLVNVFLHICCLRKSTFWNSLPKEEDLTRCLAFFQLRNKECQRNNIRAWLYLNKRRRV